jgi:AcrR family transcriptional regulator
LRERVLAASRTLLETEGLGALSMREVARRAGVTHQAPYHHFPDKESILAELVARAFDELADVLREALERAQSGDARSVAVEVGMGYVRFALGHPGIFRVMFRPEIVNMERFPAAEASSERAHAQLQRLVAVLGQPGDPGVQATLHWSVVHGLACLLVDGVLGKKLGATTAQEVHVETVLRLFALGTAGSGKAPRTRAQPRRKVGRASK